MSNHIHELKSLGENIRKMRQSQKSSQENLSFECDLHRTYLSDVERGSRNVSIISLLRIAYGLGTTVSQLTVGIEAGAKRCESAGQLEKKSSGEPYLKAGRGEGNGGYRIASI
jgi:transcriptional regulator with XRE-family HTH domain